MCRMMGVVGTRGTAQDLAGKFRAEAKVGRTLSSMTPGHADGWGIAYADVRGGLHYAGRSTADATVDPAYSAAVKHLAAAADRTVVLAHVRKMSAGRLLVEHTHPFIRNGFALAHNGTVFDIAPEGESDSATLMSRIDMERQKGASIEDAIVNTVRAIDHAKRYTSLTMLVTDGKALWGLRKIGNDPATCAPETCAADYYTLGHAKMPDGSVVVSQEHEVMGIQGWHALSDGELVHVTADGHVSAKRVL